MFRLDNKLHMMFSKCRVFFFANILLMLISVVSAYFVISYSSVNIDSAYYLSTSRFISDGYIPFKELMLTYPPLCFYFLSIVYNLYKHADYQTMLTFVAGVKLLDSALVYFISRKFGNQWNSSFFIAIVYFLSTLVYEGNSILLENFVIFFHLISILCLLSSRHRTYLYGVAGLSVALSFLCKQYGLFILPAVGVYLLLEDISPKKKILRCALFFFGFLVPIYSFILYYTLKGVTYEYILFSLNGQGYGERSFYSLLYGSWTIIIRNGLFLFAIPFILYFKRGFDATFWFILVALLGSFSPLYFNFFGHYFLLILPFLFLLKAYIIRYWNYYELPKFIRAGLAVTIALSFIVIVFKNIKENIIAIDKDSKEKQIAISKIIMKEISQDNNVMCYSQSQYNYLCNFKPLEAKYGGFMMPGFNYEVNKAEFSRFISYDKYVLMAKKADFLVLVQSDYSFFLKNHILEGFEKKMILDAEIEIWKKRRLTSRIAKD